MSSSTDTSTVSVGGENIILVLVTRECTTKNVADEVNELSSEIFTKVGFMCKHAHRE